MAIASSQRLHKIFSHFESNLWFGSTQVDEINSGTKIHAVYPTEPISCLLMLWQFKEPGHQQTWYWPTKPEYSVSSIRKVERGPYPDNKVHRANMGPSWVLSAPDGPHVGPMINVVFLGGKDEGNDYKISEHMPWTKGYSFKCEILQSNTIIDTYQWLCMILGYLQFFMHPVLQ